MPKRIAEIEQRGRITFITISNEWYTLTPWKFRGQTLPYFAIRGEVKETVKFTYIYVGPIGIISGKWIGDRNAQN